MLLPAGRRQGAARSCRQIHLAALPAKPSKDTALHQGKLRHEVPKLASPGAQPTLGSKDKQTLCSKPRLEPHDHP